MRLLNYIIYILIFIAILNIAWPLLVGLFLFLILNALLLRWRMARARYTQQKQETFYETIETPKSGLDIIDVEYEEKKSNE